MKERENAELQIRIKYCVELKADER